MRILMLGGTGFVGRHITEAAIDRGHDVTLFNRGQTNLGLFPSAKKLVGDRNKSELDALGSGAWDAAVDVNGYIPRHVRESAQLLAGRVGHYTFVSTGSVYARSKEAIDESSALVELEDPSVEEVTGDTYGGLKVLCENEARAAFPGHCVNIRAGIVAGPHDPTDRFTYWVRRLTRPEPVLAPARPDQPVQVVHARDQAEFVLDLAERDTDATFNTAGPGEPLTLAGLIAACAQAAGTDPEIVWTSDEFLRAESATLPLSLPEGMGMDGLFKCSSAAAIAAGLVHRPITETAADTLAWDRTRDQSKMAQGTLGPDREAELLEKWKAAGA